jgi:hypothetical protein
MSDEDEQVWLGCVSMEGRGLVAIGSVEASCAECGTAVWVAPSGLALMEEKGAQPTCLRCVANKVAADDDVEVEPMSEKQIAEMVATLLLHARRN